MVQIISLYNIHVQYRTVNILVYFNKICRYTRGGGAYVYLLLISAMTRLELIYLLTKQREERQREVTITAVLMLEGKEQIFIASKKHGLNPIFFFHVTQHIHGRVKGSAAPSVSDTRKRSAPSRDPTVFMSPPPSPPPSK
jgi:hypothetical protein